jgi:hypothetical protein
MSEKVKSEARMTQPKPSDRRQARLAAALRENLRKRKDQARGRETSEPSATVPPETPGKR